MGYNKGLYTARGGGSRGLKTPGSRELKDLNVRMTEEIREINKRLQTLPYTFRHTIRRKVLIHAAQPLVKRAKELAPIEKRNRIVYITATDRKTGSTHQVKYYPGNLKKSIRVLEFKRSQDVFVGPKVQSKARASAYGRSERNVNAFYAHFVEFGRSGIYTPTPYMRPAADMAAPEVFAAAKEELQRQIFRWARELEIEARKNAV